MLSDPGHLFRRMWAAEAWGKMAPGRPACWERQRDHAHLNQDSPEYFDKILNGAFCNTNWYEGNAGELGDATRLPYFSDDAPALLGFDESIDDYCQERLRAKGDTGQYGHAGNCVVSNLNILSLYGDRVPYNVQACCV